VNVGYAPQVYEQLPVTSTIGYRRLNLHLFLPVSNCVSQVTAPFSLLVTTFLLSRF